MAAGFDELWVPLRGSIVHLEPLAGEHEEGLWEAAQASDWTWMPVDAGSSHDAFRRWFEYLRQAAEQKSIAPFTTVLSGGRIVGSTQCHDIRPEHGRFEIGGTWFARDAWRTGANVEAKLLQLEHAFELGFQRVEFKTHPENERSRRALEALPAQFEGILRKHLRVRDGQPRDSAYYSVTDDEWPAVRDNLRRRLEAAAADDRVQQPDPEHA
jgi:RimJ/RimL family protein N-acetyltransferase